MLRIAVCDDELEQIEIIKGHIVRILFRLNMDAKIAGFSSSEELLASLGSGDGYEIIFLDISIASANGIDTAKEIREKDRKTLIIFVTGKAEYMQMGYEVRAFRYLLKPATEDMMEDVLKQAIKEIQWNERGCITFKEKGEEVKVDIDDILYFEAQNHQLCLVCTNASHNFYGRLGEIEVQLSGKGFVRCQKGYLVNAVHIRRIGRDGVLMDNNRLLPVSSNYLRQTKETFLSVLR